MLSERLANRRKELNISQSELAKIARTTKQTISKYENDVVANVPYEKLILIADALNCDPAYLMGWIEDFYPEDRKGKNWIPVLGTIRAGIPITAIEEILDYEEIPEAMARSGEHFALQIKGDSMEPRFKEKDVVIVRKQSTVENNEIAIVIVNGDEATIKKVSFFKGGLNLIPLNTSYETKTYTTDEIQSLPVEILGKVVELRAKF